MLLNPYGNLSIVGQLLTKNSPILMETYPQSNEEILIYRFTEEPEKCMFTDKSALTCASVKRLTVYSVWTSMAQKFFPHSYAR